MRQEQKFRNDGATDHEMVLASLEMNLKHAEEAGFQ
jgi:hypothetical protein